MFLRIATKSLSHIHCAKSVQIRSFFWSLFPRIWTKYRKIRTTKTSVFGHFLRVVFRMTYSLVWMSILNSLFCCFQVWHLFYFVLFQFFLYAALFINFSKDFCVLISTYCFSHCDQLNSNTWSIFLASILILSKVLFSLELVNSHCVVPLIL